MSLPLVLGVEGGCDVDEAEAASGVLQQLLRLLHAAMSPAARNVAPQLPSRMHAYDGDSIINGIHLSHIFIISGEQQQQQHFRAMMERVAGWIDMDHHLCPNP